MSNIKFILPAIDELSAVDTLALEDQKTIYPFNLSAKNIKLTNDMSLAEKYPFTIETNTGYTYQIVKDGKKISEIQLSNETGLEIKGDAKFEKLLKVFFLDESKTLYRNLINQLTKMGNNQLFILVLGMKAKKLVQGDVNTVSMIKAPSLKIITGDEWIKLVIEVIKDISWGYFNPDERLVITSNFENELRDVIDVELKMLGVNIPALEKAVNSELKMITSSDYSEPKTEELKNVTEPTEEAIPVEPIMTREEVNALNFQSLLEVLKERSLIVYEHCQSKYNSKIQLVKYLEKKQWIKEEEPATVEATVTEVTEQ